MKLHHPIRAWRDRKADRGIKAQVAKVEAYLEATVKPHAHGAPVLIFNASTRIHKLSLNAAFSLLTAWSLRARGIPVRHLVCQRGMTQCILGTQAQKPSIAPPCSACMRFSRQLFPENLVLPLNLEPLLPGKTEYELSAMSVEALTKWVNAGHPLGQLVLPGLRWALRRHDLEDAENIRALYRQYLGSAVSLLHNFEHVLTEIQPRAVVVFNGIFYPEAVLRYVAARKNIPVITHEVGLQPFSAFFSHQDATFRDVDIIELNDLSDREDARLDAYLGKRFKGEFSMAGIHFWQGMGDLPEQVNRRLDQYSAVVPVFTNVIFDTSQIHANAIFSDMFTWLNQLIAVMDHYEDVLFIVRAHPDENRPGKASTQSVAAWGEALGLHRRENIIFVGPEQGISSYQLIERAKLVLAYNSSIGLEASILGKPVLCAGRARYTQAETVYFPGNEVEYWAVLEGLLQAKEIQIPAHFQRNARYFLYHELFRASLDLSAFLDVDPTLQGMVTFKHFSPEQIMESPALEAIAQGILQGNPFTQAG